ncbi:MAG: YceI family protein [Pseudomonadota bacterium]
MKSVPMILTIFVSLAGAQGPVWADPVTYAIDNDHTHIVWQVDRFGFTNTVGTFVDVTGALTFDPQAPENSEVHATIALAGLRSDLEEREDIVRGSHWLDAASHPEIGFRSSRVADGADCECLIVTGDMTLKGATHPIELQVTVNKTGTDPVTRRAAAGFSARGSFQRSRFGLTTAVGPIGDTVSFEIQALAIEAD